MSEIHTGYKMTCIMCGAENSEKETSTYCTSCGGVLQIEYDQVRKEIQYPLASMAEDPLKNHPSALRRLNRLSDEYAAELYAKLEFEHPTGCFKDRGSYIEVQKALELGADAICLASTGNMAASVAAYACYFKIPCYVFVPERTSEAKLAQATIYDATIIRIQGDFTKCEALCREFAKSGNYYLAGDYVFREEGQKSFSYELVDQQNEPFDYIFIPVGCGTNFGAIYKGFKEMKEAGLIDSIPHLVAVQPESSSPVVQGIFKREKVIDTQSSTMASSVAASNPIDFYKVLRGIDDTNGEALTVTEDEILESLREMATKEGHFTEPACALPLASFKNHPDLFKGKRCLFVLTGSGLKDTKVVATHSLTAPVLKPDLDHIHTYINSGFVEIQKKTFGKSRDTALANLKMGENHERMYKEHVERMNKRGKTLRKNELEYLQTMVLNEETGLEFPAEVLDYKVTMRKEELVEAGVKLLIGGKEIISKGKGVGPIDAVLNAIKSETDNQIPLEVINHEVEILSPDTDSLVIVTLTLGKDGQQWRTNGASADTIEAVIKAYEKGLAIAQKAILA
ncbi:threonine synthase [Rhodohalobacter sp. SW132]|uniref:threonine synthase n=1 Tax=Rhodohalobacter sp. SW132 TaxID=2293433 RepID=UPI000E233144|nr:threonine synthase [Rhodohalobacter sp. SW132]REL24905.1 threonine synthase [Rhodohalobacter sp. SW132]